LRNPNAKSLSEKWCEYQTVPHIHTPASPFVGGRE